MLRRSGAVAPGETAYVEELLRDTAFIALAAWLVVRPRTLFAWKRAWLTPEMSPARTKDLTWWSVRNDKQRRQDAAAQTAGRRRHPGAAEEGPNRTVIIVAAVLAVALLAGLSVWYFNGRRVGRPDLHRIPSGAGRHGRLRPVVVDVYEDYLCPICERFEERYGSDLTTALNENKITVRYHSIAILDELTTPQGYSTRAANAALCSVSAGIYPAYHKKLFDSQPAERSAGLTDAELIALAADLKPQGDFAGCVNGSTNWLR